jgi:hypothetical protein
LCSDHPSTTHKGQWFLIGGQVHPGNLWAIHGGGTGGSSVSDTPSASSMYCPEVSWMYLSTDEEPLPFVSCARVVATQIGKPCARAKMLRCCCENNNAVVHHLPGEVRLNSRCCTVVILLSDHIDVTSNADNVSVGDGVWCWRCASS